MNRRLRIVAAALAVAAAVSGCSFKGAYSLPLPGGNAGGNSYHVTAVFDDVQDLVPMAAVRVNDVAVGDVTGLNAKPQPDGSIKAYVSMRIRRSVQLPANAVATLEQTTLLGEKYIAIGPPTGIAPVGRLHDGATIPESATRDLPDVEQLFGVLSAVLNGGDLQDLQTIDLEVSKALSGREAVVKDALAQLDTFVRGLDGQKSQIVRALDALDRFSGALARQSGVVATALDDLGPGLKVLADERAKFTGLLSDLSRFGRVASHIITASRQQTVAGLRDLQPILRHLRAAGSNLPHALELLITFPFPRNIDWAIPGDYNGLKLSFDADPLFCALMPPPLPSTCSQQAAARSRTSSTTTTKGGVSLNLPSLPPIQVRPSSPSDVLRRLLEAGLPGSPS